MVTDRKFEELNSTYKRCKGACPYGLTSSTCAYSRWTRNTTAAEEKAVGYGAAWCVRQLLDSEE